MTERFHLIHSLTISGTTILRQSGAESNSNKEKTHILHISITGERII